MFKALSDPTRRILVEELADRDEQTLFELCVRLMSRHGLEVSRQAVAKHLDVLEHAALVTIRREGRYRLHSLDRAPLRATWDEWFRPLVTLDEYTSDRHPDGVEFTQPPTAMGSHDHRGVRRHVPQPHPDRQHGRRLTRRR